MHLGIVGQDYSGFLLSCLLGRYFVNLSGERSRGACGSFFALVNAKNRKRPFYCRRFRDRRYLVRLDPSMASSAGGRHCTFTPCQDRSSLIFRPDYCKFNDTIWPWPMRSGYSHFLLVSAVTSTLCFSFVARFYVLPLAVQVSIR